MYHSEKFLSFYRKELCFQKNEKFGIPDLQWFPFFCQFIFSLDAILTLFIIFIVFLSTICMV